MVTKCFVIAAGAYAQFWAGEDERGLGILRAHPCTTSLPDKCSSLWWWVRVGFHKQLTKHAARTHRKRSLESDDNVSTSEEESVDAQTTWGMQVWCAHTPLQLGATIQDCSTRQQPSFVIINVSIYSRVLYIWYLLHYCKDWHSTLFKNKVENKNYLSIHVVFCSQYFVSGDISHWGGDIAVVDNGDLVGVALGKIGESGVFRGSHVLFD